MPSFLSSTLSLMTLLSLLTVIYCIVTGTAIQGELLAVITGVIGAYTGSRLPNTKTEQQHSQTDDDLYSNKLLANDPSNQ